MASLTVKREKIICPECNGNGYIRVPYHLAKEEIWANCEKCSSQGEIDKDPAEKTAELREKGLI